MLPLGCASDLAVVKVTDTEVEVSCGVVLMVPFKNAIGSRCD